MIKNNKFKAFLSSVIILLPILFGLAVWEKLPDNMVSHWGGDGVADGFAPKSFMIFGMPLILLALHWLCLLVTALDKKQKNQSKKVVALIYYLMPALSLAVNGFMYATALGEAENAVFLIPLLLGLMFLFIGNYLPKTTRNRTMGIKLRWTMGNDENWQKTHRLGGMLYVAAGIAILAATPFSLKITVTVLLAALIVAVPVPILYSYALYRKHKAAGIEYEPVFNKKTDKVALWITATVVPLILAGVAVLMFTGDISVTCGEDSFRIEASYYQDLTIRYEDIDTVEYREDFSIGVREMGFNSARLSIGTFQNDEFGAYTLYGYTRGEGCVVLKQGGNILVIVGKTAEETQAIYHALSVKIPA